MSSDHLRLDPGQIKLMHGAIKATDKGYIRIIGKAAVQQGGIKPEFSHQPILDGIM
jgi:hypothetical protein